MGEAFLYCVCRRTHTYTLSHSHTHTFALPFFLIFLLFGFSLAFLFSVANQSQVCTAIMIAACLVFLSSSLIPFCSNLRVSLRPFTCLLRSFNVFRKFFPLRPPPPSFLSCSRRFFCLAAAAVDVAVLQRFCFLAGSCSSVNNFIISATLRHVHTQIHTRGRVGELAHMCVRCGLQALALLF